MNSVFPTALVTVLALVKMLMTILLADSPKHGEA
jgi:hypothetical protein